MANRYRNRISRSRTPDPESSLNQSWMTPSRSRVPRRSTGGWGSMGNLDQIMNTLQESIQKKQKDCYSSFESLDNLSDEDDDSGIRLSDKWKDSDLISKAKHKTVATSEEDEDVVFLPRRKNGPRSLQGSRENISEHDSDFRINKRTLPKVRKDLSSALDKAHDISLSQPIVSHNEDHVDNNLESWAPEPALNLSGSADIGLSGSWSMTDDNLDDNWIMKQPDRSEGKRQLPTPKSSSWATPVRPSVLNISDMNNNENEDSYTPRFTKNPTAVVDRKLSSARRSRWDCESPVTIRHEDSRTETLTRDGRSESDGYQTLPLAKKSQTNVRNRVLSSERAENLVKTPTKRSPNPKFRKGFSLNAQRQLSNQSESDDSVKSSLQSDKSRRSNSQESPSPRSKWQKSKFGHSELSEVTRAVDQDLGVHSENHMDRRDMGHDNSNSSVEFNSGNDNSASASRTMKAKQTPSDKNVQSTVKDEDSKEESESPNKSYEAFFVSCGDDDTLQQPAWTEGMTEEERAIKFPQWVIPFIDDKLSGKFEYSEQQKRAAMNRKRTPSTPRRQSTSPAPNSPRRGTAPSPKPTTSPPVAPPRVKRTAAMSRIMQEKDDLACRERPLPEKVDKAKASVRVPERVKSPDRVKSPVRTPKRLPKVPSESTLDKSSDAESFPVHHVQHAKAPTISATKGVRLRTAVTQKPEDMKHSQSDTKLSQRSRSLSRTDLSRTDTSRSSSANRTDRTFTSRATPKSSLASNRAKSMDNLALLSSLGSDKKEVKRVTDRRGSTGASLSSAKLQVAPSSGPSGPVENRAMRAMREARARQSQGGAVPKPGDRSRSRTPVQKEPLTPTSSMESRDSRSSAQARSISGRSTPVDGKRDSSTTRTRARARFERQDSSESNTSSVQSDQRSSRTRTHTPVRRCSSLSVSKENEDYAGDTFTLPRRRTQVEAASTHPGGYGTLKTTKSTTPTPKKSILKKTIGSTVSKPGPDTAKPEEVSDTTTRSGKRVLPRPPDDLMDDVLTDSLMDQSSWMSVSRENLSSLSRSSSRDDLFKSPLTVPAPSGDDTVRSPTSSVSRAPSTSSDGSARGLKKTPVASSRENLAKRTNTRDSPRTAPRPNPPPRGTPRGTGTGANAGTGLRKTGFSSSRDNLLKNNPENSSKGLTKTGFSSSRENLVKNNLESSSKSLQRSGLSSSRDSLNNSSDSSSKGLRKTGLSASQGNLHKRTNLRDNLKSPTTVKGDSSTVSPYSDNSIRALRRSGFKSSRENLFKCGSKENLNSGSMENLNSTFSSSRENLSATEDKSIISVKSPGAARSRKVPPTPSRFSRRSLASPPPTEEPRSPTLAKTGLQPVDSIKINKKTRQPTGAANRKVSDRFKKLLEGEVTDLSAQTPATKNGGMNDRENSFDSGVEFIMHL